MSDETKTAAPGVHEYERVLRAALADFLSGLQQPEAEASAATEANADARVKAQLAANEDRFAKELAFRERMVAEQLRAETAATILAALIQAHAVLNAARPGDGSVLPDKYTFDAVKLADALRAELAKVKP